MDSEVNASPMAAEPEEQATPESTEETTTEAPAPMPEEPAAE
ncbi:MAG TPA: hypothetical protein VFS75_02805 [Candidatus Paceibacterota bacterium]|nr:hypothetical protein [Candidatus Paceibacterota bacterium]